MFCLKNEVQKRFTKALQLKYIIDNSFFLNAIKIYKLIYYNIYSIIRINIIIVARCIS